MKQPLPKRKKAKSIVIWLMVIAFMIAFLSFDLWYFVLWSKYGWYPFQDLKASDILSAKVVVALDSKEAQVADEDIVRLAEHLKKVKIYPTKSKYEEPDGGRFLQFKVVFKKRFWKEVWLSDNGKYFWIDWVPYFQAEEYWKLDHGFSDLYSGLKDKYYPDLR